MASRDLDLLARVYERVLQQAHRNNPNVPLLGKDIVEVIFALLGLGGLRIRGASNPTATMGFTYRFGTASHPAETPLPRGACPFMKLPSELLRIIFAESFAVRNKIVRVSCDDNDDGSEDRKIENRKLQPARRSHIAGLMTLNKRVCTEIATVIYEEREFAVHVHEGFVNGGIEFLNAGRQPLQYRTGVHDFRFQKFAEGESFGFDRIKKLRITIYSAKDSVRMMSVNTHFMNLALVDLLDRAEGEECVNLITKLIIDFVDHIDGTEPTDHATAKKGEGGHWWDAVRGTARQSGIHGCSNIQLALLPFSKLRCHNFNIHLPAQLAGDEATAVFLSELESKVQSKTSGDLMGDEFRQNMEKAWYALDEAGAGKRRLSPS
ncbi:hypothetical protein B0A50_00852 [Salinomyces thailandicus]|uniref:Uncharacterized protein n=1 Tax=Salinomyces thailandicus TaxID=706561 RepID=A0A4V5N5U7_9PEZI|nr:hypothetical protein B0A50_00852 [Salinomyces thailandica]